MKKLKVAHDHLLTMIGLVFMLASCGSVATTTTSSFKLRMQAIYSPPAGATGTDSPQSQTFLFKALKITKSDGTIVPLYTDSAKTFKVIDRPQVLYTNEDMSTYDGLTFTKASVDFDKAVVVSTRNGNLVNLSLTTGTLDLVENFTISKGQTQTLTIKTSWGKTVTENADGTESAAAPTFTMVYSHD